MPSPPRLLSSSVTSAISIPTLVNRTRGPSLDSDGATHSASTPPRPCQLVRTETNRVADPYLLSPFSGLRVVAQPLPTWALIVATKPTGLVLRRTHVDFDTAVHSIHTWEAAQLTTA